MKLPKEINYAEAYITLRCNLGCDYCINNNDGVNRKRTELSGRSWADNLNKVDFGDVPLTLGGGEPTLHKDFYEILSSIKPETKVDLLTNLQFEPTDFISQTKPERFTRTDNPAYRAIRVSYHVDKMNPLELISEVKELTDEGFPVGIFGINHPHNIAANMQIAELARENQVYFFVKDFLGIFNGEMYGHFKYPEGIDGNRKTVSCRSKELIIAPDGLIYKCHRDLYHKEHSISSILKNDYIFQNYFTKELNQYRKCDNFGKCNPCDLKLKTNRFLDMGHCQVEIKK